MCNENSILHWPKPGGSQDEPTLTNLEDPVAKLDDAAGIDGLALQTKVPETMWEPVSPTPGMSFTLDLLEHSHERACASSRQSGKIYMVGTHTYEACGRGHSSNAKDSRDDAVVCPHCGKKLQDRLGLR